MADCKILIDRLKSGTTLKIEEMFAPFILGPNETDLRFETKVKVSGETYLTDSHLIVHLKAETKVRMPCAVCNEMIAVELKADNFYHTEPIEEIKGAIFDYSEALREALLVELPKIVECREGNCPQREVLKPYLKSETREEKTTYIPFADMNKN